jgi:hypothetical protein
MGYHLNDCTLAGLAGVIRHLERINNQKADVTQFCVKGIHSSNRSYQVRGSRPITNTTGG